MPVVNYYCGLQFFSSILFLLHLDITKSFHVFKISHQTTRNFHATVEGKKRGVKVFVKDKSKNDSNANFNSDVLVLQLHNEENQYDQDIIADGDGDGDADADDDDALLLKKVDEILQNNIPDLDSFIQSAYQKIDQLHFADLELCSSFASEFSSQQQRSYEQIPNYSFIQTTDTTSTNPKPSLLALQTNDIHQPILNQSSIDTIIHAAESIWFKDNNNEDDNKNNNLTNATTATSATSKSRFTYQRRGNYEAHLVDLANIENGKNNKNGIYQIMNETLLKRVYPMVRKAFQSDIPDINELEFCIYDSLIIRYNSSEAMLLPSSSSSSSSSLQQHQQQRCNNDNRTNNYDEQIQQRQRRRQFMGAGQPLHRDKSIVSVNIMLNSDNEFEGGGTFFENQMRVVKVSELEIYDVDEYNDDTSANRRYAMHKRLKPLKPTGIGQAVAHLSSQRHAGTGTTKGCRDILVLFLTAKKKKDENRLINMKSDNQSIIQNYNAPTMERAARLKVNARGHAAKTCTTKEEEILHRMAYLRLTIENTPFDGEAWHYLGMALRDYAKKNTNSDVFHSCIKCLERALILSPCDGRLCNNIGLTYETLFNCANNNKISNEKDDSEANFHTAYEQAFVTKYFTRSQKLHDIAEDIGCDVLFDSDMTCLNHGLYVSNQDRFSDAAEILRRFENASDMNSRFNDNPQHMRIIRDGEQLLKFCVGMSERKHQIQES